mgnify:CR=1 FL=1
MSLEAFAIDLATKSEFSGVPIEPVQADPALKEAVTITQLGGYKTGGIGGSMELTRATYDINIYADSYSRAISMQNQIYAEYNNSSGVIQGVLFKSLKIINAFQTATSTSPILFQVTLQLDVIT